MLFSPLRFAHFTLHSTIHFYRLVENADLKTHFANLSKMLTLQPISPSHRKSVDSSKCKYSPSQISSAFWPEHFLGKLCIGIGIGNEDWIKILKLMTPFTLTPFLCFQEASLSHPPTPECLAAMNIV